MRSASSLTSASVAWCNLSHQTRFSKYVDMHRILIGKYSDVTEREVPAPRLAADTSRGMQLTHVVVIDHYT